MSQIDALEKFKNAVKVGIIWDKKANKLQAVFENSSDLTFYFLQGQFLYFNKQRRLVGVLPVVYKYLNPGQVLFDHFEDTDVKLSPSTYTIVFLPSSVELANPYNSTSLEEREIKLSDEEKLNPRASKVKKVFDTDFFTLPESSD
jgi:hypothetical protein